MDEVLVAMPAYNESKAIGKVVRGVIKQGFPVLVVDDCSSDNTFEEAEKAGAVVLKHVLNRGAGAARMTAIEYAREKNYDYLILMDSDGQHAPEDIKKLFSKRWQYDVVLGARDVTKMPLVRNIANRVGNLVTKLFFGLYVTDSQSGFKLLNKQALHKIELHYDRYEFESEFIGEVYRHNLKYGEVTIQTLYPEHARSGQSIKNGFMMILRFIMGDKK